MLEGGANTQLTSQGCRRLAFNTKSQHGRLDQAAD
jgi:hypothetical protein